MSGKFGFGTTFSVTIADVLEAIAELTSISGPEISVNEIDVTSHDSPDGYMEFLPGLKDGGSVTIEGNFENDASQLHFQTLIDNGVAVPMEIAFPNALATWTFDGFVTAFSTDAPHDDKIDFTATIKVTGKPVLA